MFIPCKKVKQLDDLGVFLFSTNRMPNSLDTLSEYNQDDLEYIQPCKNGQVSFQGDQYDKVVYGYGLISKGELVGAERFARRRDLQCGDVLNLNLIPIKPYVLENPYGN